MLERGLLAPPRKLLHGCYNHYDSPEHYISGFSTTHPSPHCLSSQQQNNPGFKLIFRCHTCEVKHVRLTSTINELLNDHMHHQDPDFWVCPNCTDAYCCAEYVMLLWRCWACNSFMHHQEDVCSDCEYEKDVACVWIWFYYGPDNRNRHDDELYEVINTQLKLAWLAAEIRRRRGAESDEMALRKKATLRRSSF